MICKISAVLKKATAEERRNGCAKYQNQITNISFEECEGAGDGSFSSVTEIICNYLDLQNK